MPKRLDIWSLQNTIEWKKLLSENNFYSALSLVAATIDQEVVAHIIIGNHDFDHKIWMTLLGHPATVGASNGEVLHSVNTLPRPRIQQWLHKWMLQSSKLGR